MATSDGQHRATLIFVVDRAGRLLLQLRDAYAPVSANQWGVPGGSIESGEAAEDGARRELEEETGLRADKPLTLFWHGTRPSVVHPGATTEWYIYCMRTDARQEDIVLGEGAAMEFTDPRQALQLDLGTSAAHFLPLFLASAEYRRLAGATQ